MENERFIVHVDMDAFFAAIEQRDDPALAGRPVVVGADPRQGKGRGVVSTCSYEARRFGIHSAMPISIAYRQCPHAVFLPVDMSKYEAVSGQFYAVLRSFAPDVEPVSIDEAFLDITGTYHLFGSPHQTCVLIKSRIREETQLTASVGCAPTKMAAKIASDLHKPDGLVEVGREGLLDFLRPLGVEKISGLGKKSGLILQEAGIRTIGDLGASDIRRVVRLLGKNGAFFWQLANGMDERPVETESEAKSISNEVTFDEDTRDKEKIEASLAGLCEQVSSRLRQAGLSCRTITLKIRLEGFKTYTRAATLGSPTNFYDSLYRQVKLLYNTFEAAHKKVRLVGVRASSLSSHDQGPSLFADTGEIRTEQVHKVIERIKARFGEDAIHHASVRPGRGGRNSSGT